MPPLAQLLAQPLFADIGEIIGVIIWIVIIAVSVISKISKVTGGAKKQPAQMPPHGRQPNQQPGPEQPRAQVGAKSIESEIEQFLRQARGDQPGPQRQNPNVQPPQSARPPQPPRPLPQNRPPARVVEAVPAERDIVPGQDFARELSQHVEQHIGQDSISRRDAHLGDYVEAADERVEHHLEEVFDHDVGQLEHTEVVDTSISDGTDATEKREKERNVAADRIRELLSTQDSIRDVFIASEILKRPDI